MSVLFLCEKKTSMEGPEKVPWFADLVHDWQDVWG